MTGGGVDIGARIGIIAERMEQAARRAARRIVAEAAANVATFAKEAAPVDTGRLRNAVTPAQDQGTDGMAWEVGDNVEYAIPVEYGTRRRAATPFIRPALENEREKIGEHARAVFAEEYAEERGRK